MASNFGISLPSEEEAIEASESNEAIEASSSDGQCEEQVIEASGSSEVLVEIETSGSNEDEATKASGSDGQTVENVEFLLQLSDEYQVKLVFDPCIKFVKNQPITRANVMKLLKIANLYDLDDVLHGCNNLLKDTKLKILSETIHLEDLDRESLQQFLEQRIERLETFLDTLYPQFMGLVGYLLLLVHQAEAGKFVSWCPTHVSNGRLYQNYTTVPAFSGCAHCCQMFIQIVSTTYTGIFTVSGRKYRYEGQHHFDESLPSVIDDFRKLVK